MVATISPRLPYSSTLGSGMFRRTLKPFGRPELSRVARPQPLRGWPHIMNAPKVAEYSNLGLKDAIPLGLPALYPTSTHEVVCSLACRRLWRISPPAVTPLLSFLQTSRPFRPVLYCCFHSESLKQPSSLRSLEHRRRCWAIESKVRRSNERALAGNQRSGPVFDQR